MFCREWEPPGSWYRQGASAIAVFDLAGGGVFTLPRQLVRRRRADKLGGIVADRQCRHGALTWDGARRDPRRKRRGRRRASGLFDVPHALVEVPPADPADRVGGHLGVMRDFVAAIRTGQPPETAGSDNLKSLGMVFAAIDSAERGIPVDIEA